MKRVIRDICGLFAILSGLVLNAGCTSQKTTNSGTQQTNSKPRIVETVDLAPGKPISPQDQAKISSIARKVLTEVSKAQQDIQAKNVEAAKKDLIEGKTLLDMLKEVLPTVKIIDHIWLTRSNLSYVGATDVQQDLVPIFASIDQLYDILPEGKAKEHVKQAKSALTTEKQKGASKANEALEAVEEDLDFREADLSVSYTSRLVKAAQADLEKGKTKEAADALDAMTAGLVFFDAAVIDPVEVAVRRIWMAKQDFASKDYKAAKFRLAKAKTALQDLAQSDNKTLHESAKQLIAKIDAIDVGKAGDNTGAALETLWQDARKLADQSPTKDKKK